MKRLLLLTASLAILTGATAASAADLGDYRKPGLVAPVEVFNPWMIRFRALGVIPDDRSSMNILSGHNNLKVSNSIVPEVDVTYFFTRNFAVEVIAGVTPHTVKADGTLASVLPGLGATSDKIGKSVLLPPTVTAQYHFYLTENIKPYVGAGVNYTFFLNDKAKGAFTGFNLKNTWGFALQAGVDYMIDKHWGINLDVKKLFLQPKYTAYTPAGGGILATGRAKINPWIIGVGVTYKF